MKKLSKKNLFLLQKGQNLIEYSLVLSLVSIISIAGISTLGPNLKNNLSSMTRTTDETRVIETSSGINSNSENSTSTDESAPPSCGPTSLYCMIRGENCSCS